MGVTWTHTVKATAVPENLVPRVFNAPQNSENYENSQKFTKIHEKEKNPEHTTYYYHTFFF